MCGKASCFAIGCSTTPNSAALRRVSVSAAPVRSVLTIDATALVGKSKERGGKRVRHPVIAMWSSVSTACRRDHAESHVLDRVEETAKGLLVDREGRQAW